MRLGLTKLGKNMKMAAPLSAVTQPTFNIPQTILIPPQFTQNQNFGMTMFMPFPVEMNDFILKLSTFKRKKLKIKKDRAKTVRKRLKRKSLRKRARYQLD